MSEQMRVDVHGGHASVAQIARVEGNVNLAVGELDIAGLRSLFEAQLVAFDELFELVTEPDAVYAAVARRDADEALDHLPRAGMDFTDRLRQQLRLRRALLVTGRGGIGKTHEVAAVARELVDERGYVVAIARPNAEQRLLRLGALPPEVANVRALWIFDDLHLRGGTGGGTALAQSLAGLCQRLDADMPARWLLLGTARDDPSARVRLALAAAAAEWGPCERVAVPEFDDATLEQALRALAQSRGVALDAGLAPALIANSDRTLRTVGFNVGLAARRKVALDATLWRPAQADSWRARFDDVAAQHPLAAEVFGAVALLRAASVPPRRPYVEALAGSDDSRTTDALVEANLLGERDGAIDAYADEALADCLGEVAAPRLDAARLAAIAGVLVRHTPREDADDLAVFGMRRLIDDDWTLALPVLDAAVERGAHQTGLLFARGLARRSNGDARGAIEDLSYHIENSGESAMALTERARAHQMRDDSDAALADLQRATELDPGYGAAHAALATHWLLRQEHERAVEHVDLAIAAGHDEPLGRLTRARSLAALGKRLEQALADAEVAQTAFGDNSILRRTRAFALAKLERHAEARTAVTAALKETPDDTDMRLYHAVYALEDGDPAAARADLMPLDERDELSPAALTLLARAHSGLEDYAAANAVLSRCLAHDAGNREVRGSRLQARWIMEDMKGVIEDCDALIANDPTDAALWSTRGRALSRLGRDAEGAADLRRALAIAPDDLQLLTTWVCLAARGGDLATARDAYQRLLATDCPASDRELARANLRYAEADWPDALASARASWQATGAPAAQLDIALSELFGGDSDAAMRTLAGATADAATRAEAQRELDFWRGRHPHAVSQAAADAFAAALRAA